MHFLSGDPGSVTPAVIYCVAQKINTNCALHKATESRRNTEARRNPSLSFWKLAPPNLSFGLVHLAAGAEKAFVTSALARTAARLASPGLKARPDRPLAQGNRRHRGHNFASRTGDLDRKWGRGSMLRTTLASSRALRAFALGLITVSATVIFTTESARRAPVPWQAPCAPSRSALKLQPVLFLHHRRRQFGRGIAIHQSGRSPPPRLPHQDHDALSAVRASRSRQDDRR